MLRRADAAGRAIDDDADAMVFSMAVCSQECCAAAVDLPVLPNGVDGGRVLRSVLDHPSRA